MNPDCLAAKGSVPIASLVFQPAILNGWAMYHVDKEYYPGIVTAEESKQIETRYDNNPHLKTEHTVIGKLVYNLTEEKIKMLDEYEGDEYERKVLHVLDLSKNETVKAWCYVWIDSIDRLVKYDGRTY